MFEDDTRRLVQVATVANTMASASNAAAWRALKWLAGQVEAGTLPARLYIPERTAKESRYCAPANEALKVWHDMARKAHADRLEPSPMPSAASTWFVHVDDLARLIVVVRAPAAASALRELLKRHSGPQLEEVQSEPAPKPTAQAEPVANLSTAGEPVRKPEPPPLTTGDIASAFDGLRWSEAQWKKPLGDKPKWLAACVAIPGRRGSFETRWNPVHIGGALISQGHVQSRSVRAKFQTNPLLQLWLETWKTYEADNFDTP